MWFGSVWFGKCSVRSTTSPTSARRGVRSPRSIRSKLYQLPDKDGEVDYYDPKADEKSKSLSAPKFSTLDADKKTDAGKINRLLPDAEEKPDAGKNNRRPKQVKRAPDQSEAVYSGSQQIVKQQKTTHPRNWFHLLSKPVPPSCPVELRPPLLLLLHIGSESEREGRYEHWYGRNNTAQDRAPPEPVDLSHFCTTRSEISAADEV
jgi:hypothetical protein